MCSSDLSSSGRADSRDSSDGDKIKPNDDKKHPEHPDKVLPATALASTSAPAQTPTATDGRDVEYKSPRLGTSEHQKTASRVAEHTSPQQLEESQSLRTQNPEF